MKNILLWCLFTCLYINSIFAQGVLKGSVQGENGDPLPGAVIYIPDLKTGAIAGDSGTFVLKNVPKQAFMVQVRLLGYTTLNKKVDLSQKDNLLFILTHSVIEADEVVVTGNASSSDNSRSSISVTAIDKVTLRSSGQPSLAGSLAATVPGVNAITTGNAIAKPLIRGLGFNHVIVVNEGIRQEGNQWGDEHGLEISRFSADRIEVLRGPASLFYGSDAMGGVINVLEPLSAPQGTVRGEISTFLSSNSNMISQGATLEGNKNGLPWRIQGSHTNSGPYKTPDYYVYNSGFNESNLEGMVGVNRDWGYSRFHLSGLSSAIGIIEGERDSADNFINSNGGLLNDEQLASRSLNTPMQRVGHYKASWVNNFVFKGYQLKINAGYQQNERKEFEENLTDPALYFKLSSSTSDIKLLFPERNGITKAIGVSGMYQLSNNLGQEFLIPEYKLADAGGFFYVNKDLDKISVNAGARYDHRTIKAESLSLNQNGDPDEAGELLFREFSRNMGTYSGSVGTAYLLNEKNNLKLNVGRGFRAPNITELSANGVHEGTQRYEIGNSSLKPETSLQTDLGYNTHQTWWSANVAVFYNAIDNFIYKRNFKNDSIQEDGGQVPVYRYIQGNSLLYGAEAGFDIHPVEQFHFSGVFSIVYGINKATETPLPFVPAPKLMNEVRYKFKDKGRITNSYARAATTVVFNQNNIDEFESPTKGYTLMLVSIGCDIKVKSQMLSLQLVADNIFNTRYYEHLSRLKYNNIWNQGRNFQLQLTIPFGIARQY